jgi:hypothetical protein
MWDGCHKIRSMYSSSIKKNSDWAQIITILSNRRAKIREYMPPSGNTNWQVDASSENYSMTSNRVVEEVPYSGWVYCVTMPLSTIIVRRNGKVAITGNCQNFPKLKPTPKLAKAMREMIAAKPGCIITEWDYKSCHALTLGYLAESPNYMRLARLDIHSFVAGHFLGCWDAHDIIREPDAALLERFAWFKSDPDRKRVRDDQAKHAILGIGNGLKAKGLYERYLENFPGPKGMKTAKRFLEILEELFPEVFAWQRRMQKLAHEQQWLKTEFGHIRRFYEVFRWDSRKGDWGHGDQAEEAISFWLSNIAFGHIREGLKALHRSGLAEKYGLFNNLHDSYMFHFPKSMLDEHVAEIFPVLHAPSKVLRNSAAPDGLVVDVEAGWGERWSDMEGIKLPVEVAREAVHA